MVPLSYQAAFLRFVLAPALILWMAGVGCVFGCERGSAARANVLAATALSAAESCPARRTHDCCTSKNAVVRKNISSPSLRIITLNELRSDLVEGCPMSLNSKAAISKGSTHDAEPASDRESLASPIGSEPTFLKANPLPVRNRSGTYLRCCVFLI